MTDATPGTAGVWRDIRDNLSFFTRLPIRGSGAPDWSRMAWAAPIAGGFIGLVGGAAVLLSQALALPGFIGAVLAVAAQAFATGALHEDGLADIADGFGGGATRETKLAIMRDSRVGAFGVVALVLTLLVRVSAIAALTRPNPAFAVAALVLTGAAARAGALTPLALLSPARADGAGANAGRIEFGALVSAIVCAGVIAFATGLFWLGVIRALFAGVLAAAAAYGLTRYAERQIGGQTGDVAGAAALLTEAIALIGLLIGGRPA